ncbi:hypothetical protein [Helicobacter zhangjianzhongii]|uniref:hypothetical protein n=1 Tax=Helicobacter zhangjianzhongii TaxID=2974574 RepID=UPI00255571EB|nr:hypothetical protein [Helicobacter sp. XJK30-2]
MTEKIAPVKKRILGGLGLFHHRFGILGFAMKKQGCAAFCAEIRLVPIAQAKGKLPALSRKAESLQKVDSRGFLDFNP